MKKLIRVGHVVCVLALWALCAATAFAQAELDFGLGPLPAGTVSYAGGSTPLVGTNIAVNDVTGIFTPSNNGSVFDIIDGTLDFTTGVFVSSTTDTWVFKPGGTVTLDGCVEGGGPCGPGDTPVLLASGTFTGTPTVIDTGGVNKIVGAIGLDIKNPLLTELFGLGSGGNYAFGLNYSFKASNAPPNKFKSTVAGSGDFTNTVIPEPASILLLGSSLLGLAAVLARRRHV
jgi:hypothetical protein